MAKALTRPKKRRSKTSDPHERELKRLRLSVCDDVGFRLYLATYDQPKRRDELIARIIKEADAEKVRITRLDLAEAGPEASLVGLLRAHLQKTDLAPGWRQAAMVTGIEQRLNYSAGPKGFAFLHQANLLRDALPEAAPVPVVLWLSRLASAALPAEAPDLWHWRAANFDFTGDLAPRTELLRELTTLQPKDEGALSGEQRQARIRMLEDLLAELEREGSPKSKRQSWERAKILLDLGTEEIQLQRPAEAISRVERALSIIRTIGDRVADGLALRALGACWMAAGKPKEAISCYEDALAIARETGNRQWEGDLLGDLGSAFAGLGESRHAIEHYEQSLKIARDVGDRQSEGNALNTLGDAYANLGEPQRAIEHYEQGLAAAREIGDRRGESNALRNLGKVHLELDQPRRGIDYYERCLAITRDIGDPRDEGDTLDHLGDAYEALGEPSRGIEYYEQALVIAREIGDRVAEGLTLGKLGLMYMTLGEPRRAVEYFEQALLTAREGSHRMGEGLSLDFSALAFYQVGDRSEAIRRMEDAIRIYEEIEFPRLKDARAQLAEWRGETGG